MYGAYAMVSLTSTVSHKRTKDFDFAQGYGCLFGNDLFCEKAKCTLNTVYSDSLLYHFVRSIFDEFFVYAVLFSDHNFSSKNS